MIYLSTIFATFFRHCRWLKATTYVFTFFTITLQFLLATERYSHYGDIVGIKQKPQSSCYLHDLRTNFARCPCDHNLWVQMGRIIYLRYVYRLRACDFFKICHSAELNKIVEARTPVNPYNDRRVSLQWLHKKGDMDIIRAL